MVEAQYQNRDWFLINLYFSDPNECYGSINQGIHYIRFSSDDLFDYRYPFREILKVMQCHIENAYGFCNVDISAYEEDEDFVSFMLKMNDFDLEGYYEHSLSYLDIYSSNIPILKSLSKVLNGIMFSSMGNVVEFDFWKSINKA